MEGVDDDGDARDPGRDRPRRARLRRVRVDDVGALAAQETHERAEGSRVVGERDLPPEPRDPHDVGAASELGLAVEDAGLARVELARREHLLPPPRAEQPARRRQCRAGSADVEPGDHADDLERGQAHAEPDSPLAEQLGVDARLDPRLDDPELARDRAQLDRAPPRRATRASPRGTSASISTKSPSPSIRLSSTWRSACHS